MSDLLIKQFESIDVFFMEDGWFNATKVALKYGQEPVDWLRFSRTLELILALMKHNSPVGSGFNEINRLWQELKVSGINSDVMKIKILDLVKKTGYVRTKRGSPENGGGTWLHPKLAIHFGYWLDVEFAVWVGEKIEELIREQQTSPLPETVPHRRFDFWVVSHAEDVTCKTQRKTFVELLNSLGFRAPIYKQTLTDSVNQTLMGFTTRQFRRRFSIPAGSRRRTRLLFNSALRRAMNDVEETACQRLDGVEILNWETLMRTVNETAEVFAAAYYAKGYRLADHVPTPHRRLTSEKRSVVV